MMAGGYTGSADRPPGMMGQGMMGQDMMPMMQMPWQMMQMHRQLMGSGMKGQGMMGQDTMPMMHQKRTVGLATGPAFITTC